MDKCKHPKYSDIQKVVVILQKFEIGCIITLKHVKHIVPMANPPEGAVWSGCALFAQACLFQILGSLWYSFSIAYIYTTTSLEHYCWGP